LARNPKSFKVNLVTDAISRTRKDHPVLGGKGLEKPVVITVCRACLEGVVIHVTDRSPGAHTGHSKGLKLQARYGACGVLRKGLIKRKFQGCTWPDTAGYPVGLKDLFKKVLAWHNVLVTA
jgi:hypothetical protein